MPNFTKPHTAPGAQTRPSTPTDKREAGTSRPAVGRKLEMPPPPQPAPQNVTRGKGVVKMGKR